MANIVHPAARFLERALRLRLRRINIPGIAIGIFIKFSRVPRTDLAAHMAAAGTDFRARFEQRVTKVAKAMNSLAHRSMDSVLAGGRRCLRLVDVAAELEVRRSAEDPGLGETGLWELGLAGCWVGFGAGWWVAGTFGAAGVLAVDAYLLCAEDCFAAVAGAVDSHADGFCYSG